MSLWLQVRGAPVIGLAMVLTLVGLALPASAASATPSPVGATVAAACFLALAVPVAVGWGCGRGDGQLETVGSRPVRWLDLMLAGLAVGLTASGAYLMQRTGLAPAGAIAARDLLVFLGLLLLAYPFVGWRVAAVIPAVYLLAVAVAGGGEDVFHPARWAWIAADGADRASWLLTGSVLLGGLLAYVLLKAKGDERPDQ
ncbi:MAG: hypothetical protein WEB29_08600 [Chloroflexota bacterium]